ncbi:DUF421 domain-containing protein [Neobacillus mesonae]|uniref:DUF421 domain-containing protein n=1 Tax=Neobacillus mesonae TaxID=1193713 RepID=UPI00203EAC66|nr:DUF421 domain-containing protein [Neobacillus mesonae]MCM3570973.1 DUF421 domain-containing protein [Neobacillus mesonae]
MDWTIVWKSLLLFFIGLVFLRLSGRKSISQMTIAQTIVMISIGTIIVQPIVGKSVVSTTIGAAVFIGLTVILEFLQLRFNPLEKLITGKSMVVIENGTIDVQQLTKLRLSVDQLEMRLRNKGISKIEDVKTATLEPNGQLGYELMEDAKPVTIGELKKVLNLYFPQGQQFSTEAAAKDHTIFNEIEHPEENHSDYLQ